MKRTLALGLTAVAVAGVVSPVDAAARKPRPPITKTFTATAPAPDPTNLAYQVPEAGIRPAPEHFPYEVCEDKVPQSTYKVDFTAPEAGKIVIDLTDFTGDWDLLLIDKNTKKQLMTAGLGVNEDERLTYRFRKKQATTIIACNWASTTTAKGKYVYTYANP